jgi:hypothetical protein
LVITLKTSDACILSANPYPAVTVTTAQYWAAQPPALQGAQFAPFTEAQALSLLAQGFVVDYPIMVLGWGPAPAVMMSRLVDGYTWVPNAGQPNVSVAPGIQFPGYAEYDPNNPPVGAISVSLNPADYPPFTPPAPPPPAPVSLVGTAIVGINGPLTYRGFAMYNSADTNNSTVAPVPANAVGVSNPEYNYADPAGRGTFQKIENQSLMGVQIFWILLPQ